MKNITQKIPPIIVVKVAFSSCVLPTNETDAYPPISTIGTSHFEIAIEFLKFTILKALAHTKYTRHVAYFPPKSRLVSLINLFF